MKKVMVGIALALALAAIAVPAPAAPDGADPKIASALARVDQGTWTQADLALLRSFPDLAASVPDPSQPVEASVASSDETTALSARVCGAWVDVWFRKRSLLGSTIYRWHHKVVYCRSGGRVSSWQSRYDYLTDADSIVQVRGLVANQASGTGGTSAWSHKQRHLEYCVVKYGCYANTYPQSKITVRGDGSYSYSGSAG